MIYFWLFTEFFKVGLFSFGGGYATLPFLYQIAEQYKWYSAKDLVDMLAISSITPGPVGLNVATFAGFKSAGLLGALISSIALLLPSLLIVIAIYKILNKFENNFYVKAILYSIKPAGCALIFSVALNLIKENIFLGSITIPNSLQELTTVIDLKALILFIGLMLLSIKVKKDALIYLSIAAICGILFNLNF